MKQLADECGVSRTPLRNRLEERGVQIRGKSDAERVKWAGIKKSRRRVQRQCGAAWEAVRGRVVTWDEKVRRARTAYEKALRIAPDEVKLADAIRRRRTRLLVEHQFPVGAYNLDLALEAPLVAVEVYSSSLNKSARSTLKKRTEHILGEGWFLVIVDVIRCDVSSWPGLAKQVLAFYDRRCRDESVAGKYAVIRGNEKASRFVRYLAKHTRIGGA